MIHVYLCGIKEINVMQFIMRHKFLEKQKSEMFDENTAPDWLTSKNTIPGSTMDMRWFWEKVQKLPVGGMIETDFNIILKLS